MNPCKYAVVLTFASDAFAQHYEDEHKIIEFVAIAVHLDDGGILAEFREHVKHNIILSDKCRMVTGVKQSDVDNGEEFGAVLYKFDKWLISLGVHPKVVAKTAFIVWEDKYLMDFLPGECNKRNIDRLDYLSRWINLTHYTQESCLRTAMAKYKTAYHGTLHQAVSDARNIAKLAYIVNLSRKLFLNSCLRRSIDYQKTQNTNKNDQISRKGTNSKSDKSNIPRYAIFSLTTLLAFCISKVFVNVGLY